MVTNGRIQAQPGDYVKLSLIKKEYEGVFLESPKKDKDIILLKLNSGYNIGFNKKDVLSIKVINKFKETKENLELKKDSNKPNIAMIITGGTIGSRLDPKTGAVSWLDTPESLFKYVPELFENVNLSKIEIPFMKGSENMNPDDWVKIAKIAKKLLDDPNIRGLIITHGTDTLHYTGSALSFFLQNLNKPVVLTYSQRSIDRASSDANLNLQCAAFAAISDIDEVVLVGHANTNDEYCNVLRGTKVRKLHSSRRDAFKPVNIGPLATVNAKEKRIVKIEDYNTNNKSKEKIRLDTNFEEKVALIKFYPGQDSSILDYYLKNKYKGIVIEMLGLGQIATSESKIGWSKKIKELINKGVIICAAGQTIFGALNPMVYSTGRELQDTGIIYLKDMLAETAFVKLGWVLGHKEWAKDKEVVKEKMLTNFVGEFNDRLEE